MPVYETTQRLLREGLPLEALRQAWESTQFTGHELVKAFRGRDPATINQRLKEFEQSHAILLALLKQNVELLQETAEQQKELEGMRTPINRHSWRQQEINAQVAESMNATVVAQSFITIFMMVVFIFIIGSLMKAFWF